MIKKYRKIPVEVEGIQFDGCNSGEILGWMYGRDGAYPNGLETLRVENSDGVTICKSGDYVIKLANGEFHRCGKAYFERNYEPCHVSMAEKTIIDKAVDVLIDMANNGDIDLYNHAEFEKKFREMMDVSDSGITTDKATPAYEWYKASERKPYVDRSCLITPECYYQSREVLIALPGNQIAIARFIVEQSGDCFFGSDEGYSWPVGIVSHWANLPSCPESV